MILPKLFSTIILLISTTTFANASVSPSMQLAQEWDIANYQLKGDAQTQAFEKLISHAETLKADNPDNADILIWEGIIKSTYAGMRSGLGALSLVKESRSALERAIKIDATALNGSAYTSLGTLYAKVPGWPLAFGDDKKAIKLLEKALVINPEDIDANYFYADYLLEHGKPKKAEHYLLAAKHAPARSNREIGDRGRHAEIDAALQRARQVIAE